MRKKEELPDYNRYPFTVKDRAECMGKAVLLCACVNYFCYRSAWAFLVLFPLGIVYIRQYGKEKVRKRKQKMHQEFRTVLQSLDTAVRAGYSMENAVAECRKEMMKIYGKESDLTRELGYMEQQMTVGVPVEKLFLDLGSRSHVEDIRSFGEILNIAKRTGGNLGETIQQMNRILGEKIRIRQEIQVHLSGKRLEQLIMSLVPGGMVLYMQLTSADFFGVLYHNPLGAAVMTGCLAVYGISFWMARRIVKIEV